MEDIVVDLLIIEEDRTEHIARHNVHIDEVVEIVAATYVYIASRDDRYLLIGKTNKDRFLTIVVGKREQENTYGLVTARPSRDYEKEYFHEKTHREGGEEHD
jgi:uncharacterized DUF497 family protein